MNKTILVVSIIAILLISCSCIIVFKMDNEVKELEIKYESSNLYQGPVPEGYDEDHFRKTGETKKLK